MLLEHMVNDGGRFPAVCIIERVALPIMHHQLLPIRLIFVANYLPIQKSNVYMYSASNCDFVDILVDESNSTTC